MDIEDVVVEVTFKSIGVLGGSASAISYTTSTAIFSIFLEKTYLSGSFVKISVLNILMPSNE